MGSVSIDLWIYCLEKSSSLFSLSSIVEVSSLDFDWASAALIAIFVVFP